ncbi:MAG: hypothetical protein ABFR97_04765 [Thermodesulfobacteriota bacterium]
MSKQETATIEPINTSLFDVAVVTSDDGKRRLHLSRSGPDYIKKQVFELDEATLQLLLDTLKNG